MNAITIVNWRKYFSSSFHSRLVAEWVSVSVSFSCSMFLNKRMPGSTRYKLFWEMDLRGANFSLWCKGSRRRYSATIDLPIPVKMKASRDNSLFNSRLCLNRCTQHKLVKSRNLWKLLILVDDVARALLGRQTFDILWRVRILAIMRSRFWPEASLKI